MWLSIIELLVFTLLGVIIVVYGIVALNMPSTKAAGILTLIFDFTSLSTRGLTPPDIVQSVQSEAQSATSAANSVISQAQTVVSSAITAIETDLTSKIPKNCSLGTRYFCLGYIDNVNCTALPLNVSDLLSRTLPASISYPPGSLESLDQELKLISFGGIEGPFILGIILTAILVIVHQYAFWKEKSIFTRLFGGLPLEIILGGVGNLVCVISFICPTIIQWVLYSKTKHLPFNITSEKGKLMGNSIAILCCAIAMAFYVVSMFWREQVLTNVIRKLGRVAIDGPRPEALPSSGKGNRRE